MNLLQSTWLDILCFNEAYRSIPYNGTIVYADDFKCSEIESKRLGIPTELDCVSRQLVLKMSNLAVTKEEYLFLKTILLLNPGSSMLKFLFSVECLECAVADCCICHSSLLLDHRNKYDGWLCHALVHT
jgi:hypothetical protein